MDQYPSRLYLMVSEVNANPNSSLDVAGRDKPSHLIKFIRVAAYLTMLSLAVGQYASVLIFVLVWLDNKQVPRFAVGC